MYKNQLQELAQRSCVDLPAYSWVREGPDHAPRFKATVSFNGEAFESPYYCATLRQAEHSAAEAALNTLSQRGPSQSLAAKILDDETSVCKNLLQETAQRAGVSLPLYTTIRCGPGHLPVFKCIVEVAGRIFAGEPAKTKKQAEKNAAMAAWSAIKQLVALPASAEQDDGGSEEPDFKPGGGALAVYRKRDADGRKSCYGGNQNRSRIRMVNVRERNRGVVSREAHFQCSEGCFPTSPSGDRSYESGGRLLLPLKAHQRSHSFSSLDSSSLSSSKQDAMISTASQRLASAALNAYPSTTCAAARRNQHRQLQPQQRMSRLSLQSRSDRFELRRPLMEELQLHHNRDAEEEDEDRFLGSVTPCVQQPAAVMAGSARFQPQRCGRPLFQSQSERFELKPSLLDELYQRDEEDWWIRGEITKPTNTNGGPFVKEYWQSAYGEQVVDKKQRCHAYYDGIGNNNNNNNGADSPASSYFDNGSSSRRLTNTINTGYLSKSDRFCYDSLNRGSRGILLDGHKPPSSSSSYSGYYDDGLGLQLSFREEFDGGSSYAAAAAASDGRILYAGGENRSRSFYDLNKNATVADASNNNKNRSSSLFDDVQYNNNNNNNTSTTSTTTPGYNSRYTSSTPTASSSAEPQGWKSSSSSIWSSSCPVPPAESEWWWSSSSSRPSSSNLSSTSFLLPSSPSSSAASHSHNNNNNHVIRSLHRRTPALSEPLIIDYMDDDSSAACNLIHELKL